MERMTTPLVPEQPVAVLSADDLKRLVKACDGASFEDRRDLAIIRLFLDTGVRLSELANLTRDDLDPDADAAMVLGKGRRARAVPFGARRPTRAGATCACGPAIGRCRPTPCGWGSRDR